MSKTQNQGERENQKMCENAKDLLFLKMGHAKSS